MIKMIAGVYGLTAKRADGSTYIKGVGAKDGAFSTDPEKEADLVRMGVAQYVRSSEKKLDLNEMSAKDLRALGYKYDLRFRFGVTKVEMIEAIAAKMSSGSADNDVHFTDEAIDDDDELPTFNATEAVK